MPKVSWLDKPIKKFKGYRQEPGRRVLPLSPTPVGAVPKPPPEPPRPPPPRPPAPSPPEPVAFELRKATAAHIINWIQTRCRVAEGKRIGQPFLLDDWQKREIERIYDNPLGTRRAILSVARKCGKTGLASVLLLVHLIGPKARPNSQLYSTAQSREQAALIFAMAAKIVRMSPELRDSVVIRESMKQLYCPDLGTLYRALSAEASTAYGLSPVFVIHDELGQVRGPRSALYDALETATGSQEEPLSIIISTQAPSDTDLLSVLIDDALAGHDPRVIVRLYTAPMTADPFVASTIRLANPAFDTFLNAKEVLSMAEDARRMPAREPEFRNLILNQRVEAIARFVSPAEWQACAMPVGDITQCDEVYGGLDLSEASDLTALVLIGKINKIWHVRCWFWFPGENVYERSRIDHVPYDQWEKEGLLETMPGAALRYDELAKRIDEILKQYKGLKKVGFDRWNFTQFSPWLSQAGWTQTRIEQKWVPFGQGTQSMSPALRELESRIKDREIAHGGNAVLNMCMANAVVVGVKEGETKDSSNRKLSKKKSTGRIDGAVALAMAVGIAPQGAKVDIMSLIG
jgi:phage terminase large subunit-like protein